MWKIPGDDFTAAVTLNVTPGLFRFLRFWLKYLILFVIPEGMDLNIPCRSRRWPNAMNEPGTHERFEVCSAIAPAVTSTPAK